MSEYDNLKAQKDSMERRRIIRITDAVTKWLAETQGLSLSAQGQMVLADVIQNGEKERGYGPASTGGTPR